MSRPETEMPEDWLLQQFKRITNTTLTIAKVSQVFVSVCKVVWAFTRSESELISTRECTCEVLTPRRHASRGYHNRLRACTVIGEHPIRNRF